MTIFQTS